MARGDGGIGISDHGWWQILQLPGSQPREKCKAAQISFMRSACSRPIRFPNRFRVTVIVLWKFTAQGSFIPSSSANTASDGSPRIVEVIGATVTVDKLEMALSRVSTTTGLFLSGEG